MKKLSGRYLPLRASAFMLPPTVSFRGIPAREFEVRKLADAGLFPSSTCIMVAVLQQLPQEPVRDVVNTHCHDERIQRP